MIGSVSIIVPAYNCQSFIIATLVSIDESIAFFRANHPQAQSINIEVIVVNDASTDETAATIESFSQTKPYFRLIHHPQNSGASAARNTGVKLSKGEILLFCDGDDLYLKEHLYVCYRALNGEVSIRANPHHDAAAISTDIGVVKTKVNIEEAVHPHWLEAIENTLPTNLCLRRECHDFIEGFPEMDVYRQIGGREDVAYMRWIGQFFKVAKANIETVQYLRYPGNSFDRQLTKFQSAPGDYQQPMSAEEQSLHAIAHQFEESKLLYLAQKLRRLKPNYYPKTLIQWQKLANDALNEQQFEDAIFYYENGLRVGSDSSAMNATALATAYHKLAIAQQQQVNIAPAAHYAQQALSLNGEFSTSDQARLHLHLGTLLLQQGKGSDAIPVLEQAVALDPTPAAQLELARACYQVQTEERGYQFTQDWFSNNLLVWQQVLKRFAHQPHLHMLELGSWEGRSACWLLDHILTHGTSTLSCIDTFEGSIEHRQFDTIYIETLEQRFDANIARTGAAHKVTKYVGRSQDVMRTLPAQTCDLLFIDGSHEATDVLQDALVGWGLIKVGGLLIFDDYRFSFGQNSERDPKVGIDLFLKLFCDKIKLVHQSYQVCLEKVHE